MWFKIFIGSQGDLKAWVVANPDGVFDYHREKNVYR